MIPLIAAQIQMQITGSNTKTSKFTGTKNFFLKGGRNYIRFLQQTENTFWPSSRGIDSYGSGSKKWFRLRVYNTDYRYHNWPEYSNGTFSILTVLDKHEWSERHR